MTVQGTNTRGDVRPLALPVWDWGLIAVALLAAFTLLPTGGALLVRTSSTPLGAPVQAILFSSVPLAAFLLPLRIAYGALNRRMTSVIAGGAALIVSALSFGALDYWLKHGPNPPDLSAIHIHDSTLTPVPPPLDGVIGLKVMQDGRSLDMGRDAASGCSETCSLMLYEGIAAEVAILSSGSNQILQRYRLPINGATCPAGTTTLTYGRALISLIPEMTLCEEGIPDQKRPTVVFDVDRLTRSKNPDLMPADIWALWRIAVHNGAMSQAVHVVGVIQTRGGGLLNPRVTGQTPLISYRAQPTHHVEAVFDVNDTGPLPTHSFDATVPAALYGVIAQSLAVQSDG
ncbi:hypothetical protein Q4555_07050 [Octadecabacter sp. 1_MG-2023]|uniref:hypothetical protein n=1 Tax=unclassified Octadecabacter TaxID=196158 RepID=UPI001C096B5E|nr:MULTISPECIES: hypothetical protein [unclassified Octadecabacter]MBU2994291.1 hypothetical protein [Octadecabacter sp. B2R22]MDO6734420.1 hypothetical protein [Octadecabacter sp. 1_MG-2023]